jgi:Flp pilus assembly pilin Flp
MFKNLPLRALQAIPPLANRFKDEEGQTLTAYGLIISAVAVAVVVLAVVAFRGSTIDAFSSSADCLHKASSPGGR